MFILDWRMVVVKYYRESPCTGRFYHVAQTKVQNILRENLKDLKMEQCFYVDIDEDDGKLYKYT